MEKHHLTFMSSGIYMHYIIYIVVDILTLLHSLNRFQEIVNLNAKNLAVDHAASAVWEVTTGTRTRSGSEFN